MHKTWVWIKGHPLIVILGVGALILLYLVFSSSGGGGGGTVVQAQGGGGTDPNELQAQTAITLAGIQAQGQSQQISAQQDVANNQIAASLAAAQIGANSQDYVAALGAAVQTSGIQSAENVSLAGIRSQVQLADISADVSSKQIAANVDMAQLASHTYEALAGYQNEQVMASYQTQRDVTQINAWQNVQLAQISSDTALQTAKVQASTEKKKSSNSLLGGIVGGVLSIFSDERLKRDVTLIGQDASGRNWYHYNYKWDSANAFPRRGVIAQEILRSDPDAVTEGPFGFLMVDYSKLN